MLKRTFEAGQFDAVGRQYIPENGLYKAVNLEYKENYLECRTDPEEFDSDLSDYITSIATTISKIWVWYPSRMPEDATGDEIYVIYNGSDLYFFYVTSSGFNYHTLNVTDIEYTADSVIKIIVGKDKLKIVDGVNRPHYIKINLDGEFVDGKLGYLAPTSKAIIEGMTEWEGSKFQEVDGGAYASEVCIVEICYCYKDKFGNYSNPSPVSAFVADYQWFEIDSDLIDTRWIRKFVYSGLQLPAGLDEDTKEIADEFVIFRRISRFSESGAPYQFRRTMEVGIADKGSDSDANVYTDTVLTDNTASTPDYGNDIPPIAHNIEEIEAVTFYADVEEDLTFPFKFKWYSKITFNNPNSFSVIGGGIRLRLRESVLENFRVSDFYEGGTLVNTQHLRFIDTDLTTMLPVIVYGHNESAGWMDVIVYVPQIVRTKSDEIYFCFTNAVNQSSYAGVSDKYNIASGSSTYGYLHGRFCVPSTSWAYQQTLFPIRCKSNKNIVCSPMDEYLWAESDEVPNRHNTENNGTMSTGVSWVENGAFAFTSLINRVIGKDCIQFDSGNNYRSVNYGALYAENDDEVCTQKIYIKINTADLQEWNKEIGGGDPYVISRYERYYNVIAGNYSNLRGWLLGIKKEGTTIKPVLIYQSEGHTYPVVKEFNNYIFQTSGELTLFIKCSVDFDNQKAHLYMVDITEQILCDEEIEDLDDDFDSDANQDIVLGNNHIGYITEPYCNEPYDTHIYYSSIPNIRYDQFDFYKEIYINNDENICRDLASFLPYWDVQHVGWDGSQHNNITFADVEENTAKRKKNKVVWTPENGDNVPATNEKYLSAPITDFLYAKSFLQFEYGVSAIIPTRNSINRFILSAEASGWASAKNMIKEYEHYGKLSKDFIVMFDSYYYGSEVGAMRWNPQGMRVISNTIINGKEVPRINIVIKSTTQVIPIPVRRQVLFYNNDDHTGWLYHENGDRWTEYNGLNIEDSAVLTKGDRLDNKTLVLDSNTIKNYPGDDYTTALHYALTKQYALENNKLRKMKANFDGSCSITTLVTNDTGFKTNINADITKMKWYNMLSGSWGYMYEHLISNFDKLRMVYDDFLKR